MMGSPHLHHASDEIQAVAVCKTNFSSPFCSPLIDVPVRVAPALPKLSLQYMYDLAIIAKHAGKNTGKRLALLCVDMARHKCIHPDQVLKSSIPLA
jgi:hypothetical protein